MKLRTFKYSVKEGVKSLYRNKAFTLASVGTIVACLFLFGVFYFLISNITNIVKQAEKSVSIVTVFFDEGTTDLTKQNIKTRILERGEVAEVSYTSSEEAWEKFKESTFSEEDNVDETFGGENPLEGFDSYEIKLEDISMQSEFVEFLENLEGVRTVKCSEDFAENLTTFNSVVAYVAIATMFILLAVSVFLISITVLNGVNVRFEEIRIMKLIGATDGFIKAPFIVEGVIIGMVGAIVPLGILFPAYKKIVSYCLETFGNVIPRSISFVPAGEIFATLIPISLAVGVGIGLMGTWLTLKRKLSVLY
ncbi:MAG: ABC transporter permease [Lachnospiraceae bacterium]|nr:ABC transporter permease [Lachnospiraceae bacterium]